jgi:hypothetical protein
MNYRALLAVAGLSILAAGCSGRAASLSCDEIAEQAKKASETQGTPVQRFKDIKEQSVTEKEKRCTATAEVNGMGDVPVYLRGYEAPDGNQMVEFRPQPFE